MARLIKRRWDAAQGLTRRDRLPCDYEAYVPDLLMERRFRLDADVAADVADAERSVQSLNESAKALVNTEALARILLRAESVASSRIEGLEIGARKLLRAEAALSMGDAAIQVTAAEVLGNIAAMTHALEAFSAGDPITLATLYAFHEHLLAKTHLADIGGQVRTEQNWIGGNSFNPCSAAFVPPPPEKVPRLLADLCEFCNDDSLPAIAQAAIAHAQFETIHPFADGNGRTGRGLIHLVMRRRGLAPRVLPPVSLILATWAREYIDGLTAFRYRGLATSRAAHTAVNQWVQRFSGACQRAVVDVTSFEKRAHQIETGWRTKLGRVRRSSATDLLLPALLGAPVVTVNSAAALIGRSSQQTNEAVARLCEAGILAQVTVGRRNRAFEAPEVIRAFNALERRLASPTGDTHRSPPQRAVPRRT